MMLLLVMACDREPADSATPPVFPTAPTSSCGEPYDWLPTNDMGSVVDAQRDPGLSLTAVGLSAILETAGAPPIVTPLYDVETWRIRYRTQDRGVEVEATGFVTLPVLDEEQALPLLLWLHPTMGLNDACAPTALGLEGAAFPILWASLGYAVVAPDYLGMAGWGEPSVRLHPYLAAEPTAVASLDAARALIRFADDKGFAARPDPNRVVHWGASEGGFAALWADRYQAAYAPELSSVATIAIIPPTDLPALAEHGVSGWSATSLGLAAALAGVGDWVGADLHGALVEEHADTLPELLATQCSADLSGLESVEELFTPGFVAAVQDGTWSGAELLGCGMEEGALARSAVDRGDNQAPVLLVTSELDDLVWTPPTREDAPRLCDQGYAVEYHECAGVDHAGGAVESLAYQLHWLTARLGGEAVEESCVVHEPEDCEAL